MTDDTGSGGDEADTDDGPADDPRLRDAVDEFLDRTDAALADYDKGYADADATLRVVRAHLEDLRATAAE